MRLRRAECLWRVERQVLNEVLLPPESPTSKPFSMYPPAHRKTLFQTAKKLLQFFGF